MYIDPHVHLRDFSEQRKETIRHGLEVARNSGVDAVFDMPNTNPPIMTRDLVLQRLRLAEDANVEGVFYGLYIGLTADPEQVARAVDVYRDFHQVMGMKLYAGHSVGNLGVISLEEQTQVYEKLARIGYDGVLAVHAEKESKLRPKLWTPRSPITHCNARPAESEVESVEDQINLSRELAFQGKLHIAHISSPAAVDLVEQARREGLDISCGVCPHHLIYDWEQMYRPNGVLWKMNPPLRSPESRAQILNYLRIGLIDWIETDHAPHTLDEKTTEPFMSGIPGLPWWNLFEEFLRRNGFTNQQIEKLTFSNALERFGLDINKSRKKLVYRGEDYPFDPYQSLKEETSFTP